LVKALIQILESNNVAIDRRHAPSLYAKFLSNMLEKYCTPPPQAPTNVGAFSVQGNLLEYNTATSTMSIGTDLFCWPDIVPDPNHPASGIIVDSNANASSSVSDNSHIAPHLIGEPDMDFSLTYFLDSARYSQQNIDAPAVASSHTDSAPEYSLDEIYQFLFSAPTVSSYDDANWLNSLFENV
jgi:hypothetical protein